MSFVPVEARPAVGIEVFGSGPKVALNLYTRRGSRYEPLHLIPEDSGKVVSIGSSEPIKGWSGPEIKLSTAVRPSHELKQFVQGYIDANGWQGSAENLQRLNLLG